MATSYAPSTLRPSTVQVSHALLGMTLCTQERCVSVSVAFSVPVMTCLAPADGWWPGEVQLQVVSMTANVCLTLMMLQVVRPSLPTME